MKAIGVIPARFGSTRFPGKPLALINGKPLLQWTIEGVKSARSLSKVLVATDDDRIADLARACGVDVAMTDSALPTGTDRVRAALMGHDFDVAVNVQGDEPLIEGAWLDALLAPFTTDSDLEMATLGRSLELDALHSLNSAKITVNNRDEALYFSRLPIPYSRLSSGSPADLSLGLKHIGLYAYKRAFLNRFCDAGPCALELAEGLEQLRALHLGARIKVVRLEADSWGVDTPEDVRKIEMIIAERTRR